MHSYLSVISSLRERSYSGLHLYGDRAAEPVYYSYPSLYAAIENAAAAYTRAGVRRGQRVLLPFETSIEMVVAFHALVRLGVLVLSVKPRGLGSAQRYTDFLARIAHNHHVDAVLAAPWLSGVELNIPLLAVAPYDATLPAVRAPEFAVTGDELAFVQFSSGSTAEPKGVPITHDGLVEQLRLLSEFDRRKAGQAGASWLPLFHDMGLIGGLLSAMYAGMNLHLCSPRRFLLDPIGWLECLSKERVTRFALPNFGIEYLLRSVANADEEVIADLRFDAIQHIFVGAEPINPVSLDDFIQFMGEHGMRPEAVQPSYGMAEAVLMATGGRDYRPRYAAGTNGVRCVSVGRPLPGFELRLEDSKGRPVADGQSGEVLLRGGTLAREYFESTLPLRDPRGYYVTGDIGFMLHGELYIQGRTGDRLKLLGEVYYAHDLERVIERVSGVRPRGAVVLQAGSELRALVEPVVLRDLDSLRDDVVQTIAREFGIKLRQSHVDFLQPGQIVRTSSGKVRRVLMQDSFNAGKLTLVTAEAELPEQRAAG